MARFSSTLMTSVIGSVGNITMLTSRGRMIAKQKIFVMGNPRTVGQVRQRKGLSIAVAMWRYAGAVLKSGITVFPQFGSQYNQFVKDNTNFLRDSLINPDALRNQDFEGIKATNGNLGNVSFSVDDFSSAGAVFNFSSGALKNIAKVGDLVKVVVGKPLESEMGYFEKVLVANDLLSTSDQLTISGDFKHYQDGAIWTLWVESADGLKSTSSSFSSY